MNDSRVEAEKSLKLIPGIKEKIAEAESKTNEARGNLAGAENDARAAKENSVQAQQTAEMASEVILHNYTTISRLEMWT